MHCYESNQKSLNADDFEMETFFAVVFQRLFFFFSSSNIYSIICIFAVWQLAYYMEKSIIENSTKGKLLICSRSFSLNVLFVAQNNDVTKNLPFFFTHYILPIIHFTKRNKYLQALIHGASERS